MLVVESHRLLLEKCGTTVVHKRYNYLVFRTEYSVDMYPQEAKYSERSSCSFAVISRITITT
jgi:hypothetical protein